MTREELMEQKEKLTEQLKVVTEELNKKDNVYYREKFENAIMLLKQCSDFLNYPIIEFDCPECRRIIDFDFDEIIEALKNLMIEEF